MGVVDEESKLTAVSSVSIGFQVDLFEDVPLINVYSYFNRYRSWTKDTSSVSLLSHEQLHFDICELYARKVRRSIRDLKDRNVKEIDKYQLVIQSKLEEHRLEHQQYDSNTYHGMNEDVQKEWINKIKMLLIQLEEYLE
jgi:predicted secreted Zn-dependent protease